MMSALCSEAVRYARRLERFRALCRHVAGYYIIERYPTFEEGPSAAEVRSAYLQTKRLFRDLTLGGRRPRRGARR